MPLLHSFAVVACVLGLERAVPILTEKNKTLEKIVESEPTLIIENGVILLRNARGNDFPGRAL